MLVLARGENQRIIIGNEIVLTVVEIRSHNMTVRLGIDAPAYVQVDREEIRRSKEAKFAAAPIPPADRDEIARDMCEIISDPQASEDERRRALLTLNEAWA